MAYQKPNNFPELLMEMVKLCERLCELKHNVSEEIGTNIAVTQDARIVFLDAVQKEISVCIMLLSLCNYARNKYSTTKLRKVMNSPPSLNSLITEAEIVTRDENAIIDSLRLGLLVKIHFQIENFFNNIHYVLKMERLFKFEHLLKALIKEVEQEESTIENAFTALSYIRNSLHNNGIYRRETEFKTIIKGKAFSFIPRERIDCGGWHSILLLIDTIVPFIEKLLNHPKVVKKDYIIDDFSYAYEAVTKMETLYVGTNSSN